MKSTFVTVEPSTSGCFAIKILSTKTHTWQEQLKRYHLIHNHLNYIHYLIGYVRLFRKVGKKGPASQYFRGCRATACGHWSEVSIFYQPRNGDFHRTGLFRTICHRGEQTTHHGHHQLRWWRAAVLWQGSDHDQEETSYQIGFPLNQDPLLAPSFQTGHLSSTSRKESCQALRSRWTA